MLPVDKTQRERVIHLQAAELLLWTAGENLVTIQTKYHNRCLTTYKITTVV